MELRKKVMLGILMLVAMRGAHAAGGGSSSEHRLNGKKIELARYAKSYVGQGNVTVDVAPYKSEDRKSGAILLIKGVEGPWDGKAIIHRVRPGAYQSTEYVTDYDDREWNTLRTGRDGSPSGALYVPEVQGEIKLAPSDGAAQLTSPEAIFQEYLKQQGMKDGGKS